MENSSVRCDFCGWCFQREKLKHAIIGTSLFRTVWTFGFSFDESIVVLLAVIRRHLRVLLVADEEKEKKKTIFVNLI